MKTLKKMMLLMLKDIVSIIGVTAMFGLPCSYMYIWINILGYSWLWLVLQMVVIAYIIVKYVDVVDREAKK